MELQAKRDGQKNQITLGNVLEMNILLDLIFSKGYGTTKKATITEGDDENDIVQCTLKRVEGGKLEFSFQRIKHDNDGWMDEFGPAQIVNAADCLEPVLAVA